MSDAGAKTFFLTLLEFPSVKSVVEEAFSKLSKDVQDALRRQCFGDALIALDSLIYSYLYKSIACCPRVRGRESRDVQVLRRRVRLGIVALGMYVAQAMLDKWSEVSEELRKRLYDAVNDERAVEESLEGVKSRLQLIVAELATLYTYLYNGKNIVLLGMPRHVISLEHQAIEVGSFIDVETLTMVRVTPLRSSLGVEKADLVTLVTTAKLPVTLAVPRYGADSAKEAIDENVIAVEHYTLSAHGGRVALVHDLKRELKAVIEEELKPLMQGIPLLRRNAMDYIKNPSLFST